MTITLKPHTGITATAKACIEVTRRIVSDRLQICWDAGNVSFYEGIHPDPDLPDLAPRVKAVCIKDHLGLRGDANFPVPGQGQVDHERMFRTHCCPVKSRTESIGCRDRVNRYWSRMPEEPVKWAFSQKA